MTPGWGDLRLAPAALAAWVASLLTWAGGPRGALALVGALWLATAVTAAAARARAAVGPLLVLAACAATAAVVTASSAVAAREWIAANDGTVELAGRAVEVRPVDSRAGAPRVAVRIEVDAWRAPGEEWRGGDGLVVVVDDAKRAPARGGEVAARGMLAPSAYGVVDALLDGEVTATRAAAGWRAPLERARVDFTDVVGRSGSDAAAVVEGMILGDTSGMPDALVAQLRAAGLAHLTAVSGAHFAILAGGLGVLLRRIRAPVVVAMATVAVCVAFAATVSGGGSVLRSVVMAGIAGVAVVAGRRGQTMPALWAAVAVLIVARPELARDAGLALSVAAVTAIAQLAPGLALRLRRVVWAPVADAAAVTLSAQAACGPLLALIAASVGPWAVAANAVAAPFAIPVTLLGVPALACAGPAPWLASLLGDAAEMFAWPVVLAARAFSAAPGGALGSATGPRGIVLGVIVLAAVVAAARVRGHAWRAGAVVALVGTVLLHAPPRWLPAAWGGAVDGWTVVACDVGQGDALVVRAGGAVVMVDVGPADDAAAACLGRLGVTRVDLLVLSHEHADHTGGIAHVREAVEVARVWLPPAPAEATVQALAGVPAETPTVGASVSVGGVDVTVLQTGPPPAGREGTEVNDSSTALSLVAGGITTVALGDLEVEGQRRLARGVAFDGIDVVKVAHHGSAAQDPALVEEIGARVALVSAGEGNDYGHPTREALAWYGEAGATVLRTDLCGDVILGASAGQPVLVRRCPDPVAP